MKAGDSVRFSPLYLAKFCGALDPRASWRGVVVDVFTTEGVRQTLVRWEPPGPETLCGYCATNLVLDATARKTPARDGERDETKGGPRG